MLTDIPIRYESVHVRTSLFEQIQVLVSDQIKNPYKDPNTLATGINKIIFQYICLTSVDIKPETVL